MIIEDRGEAGAFGKLPGPQWTLDDKDTASRQGWRILRIGTPKASFDEAWDQIINWRDPDLRAGDSWLIASTGVEQRNPDGTRGGILSDAQAVALVDNRAKNGDKLARRALAFIAYRRISGEVD